MSQQEQRYFNARARYSEPKFRPYVIAIGQASLAWNSLNEQLGNIFWVITGGGPLDWQPLEIWQSMNLDRPKREMLRAAANRPKPGFSKAFPSAVEDIKWLCGEADKLEDIRNNTIHAPLVMTAPKTDALNSKDKKRLHEISQIEPQAFYLNRRAARLSNKDLLSEFRWCRDTALTLRDYSESLFSALRQGGVAWPRRPKLPAHRAPRKRQSPPKP